MQTAWWALDENLLRRHGESSLFIRFAFARVENIQLNIVAHLMDLTDMIFVVLQRDFDGLKEKLWTLLRLVRACRVAYVDVGLMLSEFLRQRRVNSRQTVRQIDQFRFVLTEEKAGSRSERK